MRERVPAERRRDAPGPAARRRGVVGGVLLAAVIAVALSVIAARGEEVGEQLVDDPPAGDEAAATPTAPNLLPGAADGTPVAPEVPLEPPPGDAALPVEREPTDADAAAFAADHRPPGAEAVESVTVDLDGDGRDEVVVVGVTGGAAQVDVATWDGDAYTVAFSDRSGPAEAVPTFEVADVTGDGRREIAVGLAAGERESLALWGLGEEGFERLTARGGCFDGSHVFGVRGASAADGRLTATCPPEAADPEREPDGIAHYTWDGRAWAHDPTEAA